MSRIAIRTPTVFCLRFYLTLAIITTIQSVLLYFIYVILQMPFISAVAKFKITRHVVKSKLRAKTTLCIQESRMRACIWGIRKQTRQDVLKNWSRTSKITNVVTGQAGSMNLSFHQSFLRAGQP